VEVAGWPKTLLPQQASVPFALIPQLWSPPVAIALKAPAGGVALGSGTRTPSAMEANRQRQAAGLM